MVAVRKSSFSGMTVSEFLDWNGDGTDPRYELVNGEPRAMAPGVQPRVRSGHNMRIPGLGVTCTPDERGLLTLPDAVLPIEIHSPSNEAETWENVWTCTTLPSVREILVLWTAGVGAELLRRQADGSWPESPEVIVGDEVLTLDSIGYRAPLRMLHAGTHLVRQPD